MSPASRRKRSRRRRSEPAFDLVSTQSAWKSRPHPAAIFLRARRGARRSVTAITQSTIAPRRCGRSRTRHHAHSTNGRVESPNADRHLNLTLNLNPNPTIEEKIMSRLSRTSLLAIAATAALAVTALTPTNASAFGHFGGGGFHGFHGFHSYHFGGFHGGFYRHYPYRFGHWGGYRFDYRYRWWYPRYGYGWWPRYRWSPRPIVYGGLGTGAVAATSAPAAVTQQANCLVKQYLPNGAVQFADMCTQEQAIAMPNAQPGLK
jgi:hypothetical protein